MDAQQPGLSRAKTETPEDLPSPCPSCGSASNRWLNAKAAGARTVEVTVQCLACNNVWASFQSFDAPGS